MNTAYLIAFAMYFSILLVIGYVAYQYSKKTHDFILGSRSINYWVTAISVQASDMSGWLLGVNLAKLAADDKLDCYCDSKKGCMVFKKKDQ